VNGRLATLSTVLKDGDTVQLLMGQDPASEPSREWLEHAHTPAARIAIQRWLTAHPAQAESQQQSEARITENRTGVRPAAVPEPGTAPDQPADRSATGTVLADLPGATVRLARCCTPVQPDEITGFAVRGGAVTVHRVECAAVARMKDGGRAEVGVRWGEAAECRVTLVAESFVRPHLLADLTEAMASEGAEIVSATVEPPTQQQVRHTYTVQLPDAGHLPGLMRAMRDVAGVYDVSRAQPQPQGD
jgi:GTP pyrophosphokinase